MRVLYGSTVISDINSYAQYMQSENDMTLSPSDKYLHSINLATAELAGGSDAVGTNNIPIVTTTTAAFATPTVGVITNPVAFQNGAINIAQMGFAPTFVSNMSSVPFSFNLKNFLGDAVDGLLPLHLITNNDLILEIEIDTCDNTQVSDAAGNAMASISVFDLQYNAILTHIPQSVSNLLYPNNSATLVGVDKYSDIKQIPSNISNINVQYDNFKYKYAK